MENYCFYMTEIPRHTFNYDGITFKNWNLATSNLKIISKIEESPFFVSGEIKKYPSAEDVLYRLNQYKLCHLGKPNALSNDDADVFIGSKIFINEEFIDSYFTINYIDVYEYDKIEEEESNKIKELSLVDEKIDKLRKEVDAKFDKILALLSHSNEEAPKVRKARKSKE